MFVKKVYLEAERHHPQSLKKSSGFFKTPLLPPSVAEIRGAYQKVRIPFPNIFSTREEMSHSSLKISTRKNFCFQGTHSSIAFIPVICLEWKTKVQNFKTILILSFVFQCFDPEKGIDNMVLSRI